MTLTKKEKQIILIKYIIHGVSPYSDASLNTRIKMLKTASTFIGIPYNDEEYQAIGRECLELQQHVNDQCVKFLTSNTDLYKTLMRELGKGNDGLITVVDGAIEKTLSKLKDGLRL